MLLGFKQYFDKAKKEPTYFREKILAGVGYVRVHDDETGEEWNQKVSDHRLQAQMAIGNYKPKLHTLRPDSHNRWKPGMSIQMVYRGPKYSILDHFNKGITELEKCVSIQSITITNHPSWIDIVIDDRPLKDFEIDQLFVNDGFSSFENFCRWFNKDFSGKIIHWTDLRY